MSPAGATQKNKNGKSTVQIVRYQLRTRLCRVRYCPYRIAANCKHATRVLTDRTPANQSRMLRPRGSARVALIVKSYHTVAVFL
jgi:hypothetical protein